MQHAYTYDNLVGWGPGTLGPVFTLDYEKREIRMDPFPMDTFLERCEKSRKIIHPYADDIRQLNMQFPDWRE